jgi:pyruvate dehydrogenase E2 component (dihydrolipoamide acetyltransferase)
MNEPRTVRLTGARKIIAERMLRSHLEYAELTVVREVDVTPAVALRERLVAAPERLGGVRASYTNLLAYVVARALPAHPFLNSTLVENEIRLLPEVHLGIAVETPDESILVPVLRHADRLSLSDLAQQTNDLLERARARKLSLEDVTGGTFTLTNYGVFGADLGTPLINPPQSAILGLGRVAEKPAVVAGQIVPRHLMWLSLTYDHRVIYGGQAARFLGTLADSLENLNETAVGLGDDAGAGALTPAP